MPAVRSYCPALDRVPFNSYGTRIYYCRSACFVYLATRTLHCYLEISASFLRTGARKATAFERDSIQLAVFGDTAPHRATPIEDCFVL